MTTKQKITSQERLCLIFSQIAAMPGSVWLDSSLIMPGRGRYSIIARNPVESWQIRGNSVTIKSCTEAKTVKVASPPQPLNFLEEQVKKCDLTAIGFIDYESTLPYLGLKAKGENGRMRFMLYQSLMTYDHLTGELTVSRPDLDDYSDIIDSEAPAKSDEFEVDIPSIRYPSKTDYLEKVRTIKEHIYQGDIYQANYTTRFEVRSDAQRFDIYRRLRELNPAPFAAFLNFGDNQILSSSPERMFRREGDLITSGPIKGTIARGRTDTEMLANKRRLISSAKDKAELLMIVDLVRNDLGKIAKTGTVKVAELHRPEVYSSVIHLVSDIEAQLKSEITLEEIIAALLPGGSITGAPKKRAVEILNELESVPRSVYTGAIGYVNPQVSEFNIAIRTIEYKDNRYYLHAGGGIVADSDPESEYDEMMLKATNLLRALGCGEEEFET